MNRFHPSFWTGAFACFLCVFPGVSVLSGRDYYVAANNPRARDVLSPGNKLLPFKSLSAACRKAGAGDTVFVDSGVYREILTPQRSGTENTPLVFQALSNDVWVKGSDLVEGWSQEGQLLVHRPWRPRFEYDASSLDPISFAPFHSSGRRDQVFLNGRAMQWYPDRASLAPGGFYWAEDGSELVLWPETPVEPVTVEVPVRPAVVAAWLGAGAPRSYADVLQERIDLESLGFSKIDWVVIRGFRFAHNAAMINTGGVSIQGENWLLEDNIVEWMNTTGIAADNRATLRRNLTRFNGQCGIGGGNLEGVTLNGNTSLGDNARQFSTSWGAGGMKFGQTCNSTIEDQVCVSAKGPAIWFDWRCTGNSIRDCVILPNTEGPEGGAGGGIFFEFSFDTSISGNTIFGTTCSTGGGFGGGVTLSSTSRCSLSGNTIFFGQSGINLIGGPRGGNPPFFATGNTLEGNLIIAPRDSMVFSMPSSFSPASDNVVRLNTWLAGKFQIGFDAQIATTLPEAESLSGGLFSANRFFSTWTDAPSDIRSQANVAASRLLAGLARVGILPAQPTALIESLSTSANSKIALLSINTGPQRILLVSCLVPSALELSSSGTVRIWDSRAMAWRSSSPGTLSCPQGLTIITGGPGLAAVP